MATQSQRNSHNRLIIAGALFLISIVASALISYLSHTGQSYWALARTLPEGAQIEERDLIEVRATIDRRVQGYLLSSENLGGTFTRRLIRAGEILRVEAITEDVESSVRESLSLQVRAADIPEVAAPGDLVTLYQVHDARNGEVVTPPATVLRGVFIESISRKSANFGSDVSVTISLDQDDVPIVLAATASGRLVVVPSNG
jgi:hypothetical protein